MSSDLPVPELRNGGRGLVALQEAGIEALAARVLGQQPSGLSYWLAVNFNVMGSHYMEMQAVAIGERWSMHTSDGSFVSTQHWLLQSTCRLSGSVLLTMRVVSHLSMGHTSAQAAACT